MGCNMTADPRKNYRPGELYASGMRFVSDYTVADAIDDYMSMHPEADEDEVRAEVERVASGAG